MIKKNKFAFILTIVLLLIAILLVVNRNYTSTLQNKDADFAVYDTASVTKIFIADLDTSEVLLERTSNGWTVNSDYLANQRKIDVMLNTMMKLRVRGPVSKSSQENVVKRMAGIAIKVEVYQIVPRINLFERIKLFPREVRTKSYFVGDNPRDNVGTFMYKEGAKHAYIMHLTGFVGFVTSRYSPLEDDWRDYTVFKKKMNEIQAVTLEFNEEPEMGYTIERSDKHRYRLTRLTDQYVYPDFDTLKVLNYLSSFADVRFESLLNNLPLARRDSVINSPYKHRLTLLGTDGEEIRVTTYNKAAQADNLDIDESLVPMDYDRLYALVNDDKDFVLIQYYIFDKLLRSIDYFERE